MRRSDTSAPETTSRDSARLSDERLPPDPTPTPNLARTSDRGESGQNEEASSTVQGISVIPEDPRQKVPSRAQEKNELKAERKKKKPVSKDRRTPAIAREFSFRPGSPTPDSHRYENEHKDRDRRSRSPTAPQPPEVRHRPQMKSDGSKPSVPKIDLTFATTAMEDEYSNFFRSPKIAGHVFPNRTSLNDNVHRHYGDPNTSGIGYADRSRRRGVACGVRFPDIQESNMIIGKNVNKSTTPRSTWNTLGPAKDIGEPNTPIKLPDMVEKPLTALQAFPSRPHKHVTYKPAEELDLPYRAMLPKPPGSVAGDRRPALHQQINTIQPSPRDIITTAFEELPTTRQQEALNNCWIPPEQELITNYWSPGQSTATTVEYLPNFVRQSPLHVSPRATRYQHIAPHPPSFPVDSLADYRQRRFLTKCKEYGNQSKLASKPNAVTFHAEQLTDVQVQKDGTMLIGLDHMHISPDNVSPFPQEVAGCSRQKAFLYPQPKKLSISEQIATFKEYQKPEVREAKARDLKAELTARTTKVTGSLEEEEKRKFQEHLLYKDMIYKPKPPHHLEPSYLAGPWGTEPAPGMHVDGYHGNAQQAPASLKKRRQPKFKKDL